MELAPNTPVSAPKVEEKAPKLPLAREIFTELRPGGEPLGIVYKWFASSYYVPGVHWLGYPWRLFRVWCAIRTLQRAGIATVERVGYGYWIRPENWLYRLWSNPEPKPVKREVDFYVRNEVN